jgi:hypothetical protein
MDATVKTARAENAVHPAKTAGIIGRPDWFPDWEGETCVLVASGPSAKRANIGDLSGRCKAIAINESYNLCPWADALYACDANWWKYRKGVSEFNGLKISQDYLAYDLFRIYPDVKKISVDRNGNKLLIDRPGHVGSGGNSGFQALNLAVQFGAKRIILVGYDMRVDKGEHWHPRHPMPMSNPHPRDNLPRWRTALDGAAGTLILLGVKVINCSDVSLLQAYPKMSIEEAINASSTKC